MPHKSDITDSTQTTINYKLTKNVYKVKNVTVNHPQITNLGDYDKQKAINISNEDLIKYFNQADSRNIEQNPS